MRKRWLMAVGGCVVSGWFALAAPGSACQATISENATVSGSWFSTCASVNRSGAYAQFYTFTLTRTSIVQIDLESSTDAYLYLLPGDRPTTNWITLDNGGGKGNARIVRTLAPGTYTIEATTDLPGVLGAFTLKLAKLGKNGEIELEEIEGEEWE